MNKIKKIGLYGGAFSPIHLGHEELINFVLGQCDFDEIWLMPAYAHTFNKDMIDCTHRINMCKLIQSDKIKVSNFECINKMNGSTYDMINKLRLFYPDVDFSFLIGQDNANCIEKWQYHEELRKLLKFVVIPRKGYEIDENDWYTKEPHKLLTGVIPEMFVSSTMIREDIKKYGYKGEIMKLLNPRVIEYIISNNLYL